MNDLSPIWHILGAGSLGSLWATRLARSGQQVKLILRNEQRLEDYRQAGGLTLIESTQQSFWPLKAEVATEKTPIQRLVVACKAYDAEPAVRQLASRLAPTAELILLQNGMGSQQAISSLLPQRHCLFASTTEGAYRPKDFQVVHAGNGFTWLGSATDRPAPSWLPLLEKAGLDVRWTPQILGKLWRKLAINCAINPLTVLHDCRNGELLEHRDDVLALCNELTELLEACGQTDAAIDLHSEVLRVITATAQNFSSMQQDVSHRRRTEIHFMLGYACHAAGMHGLTLPCLQQTTDALRHVLQEKGLPFD